MNKVNNIEGKIYIDLKIEFFLKPVMNYGLDPLRTGILLCDKERLYIKLQTLIIFSSLII